MDRKPLQGHLLASQPKADLSGYAPSLAEQDAYEQRWLEREKTLTDDQKKIWFQGDYVKELIKMTDYPSFDVEGVNKTFLEWKNHKHENIMTFRDKAYKSLMTGNMAPVHHTPWTDALEDTIESYGLAATYEGNIKRERK